METPQTHTIEEASKTDEAILAGARETTRRVGAVAEQAAFVLDSQTGAVMTPEEVEERRSEI